MFRAGLQVSLIGNVNDHCHIATAIGERLNVDVDRLIAVHRYRIGVAPAVHHNGCVGNCHLLAVADHVYWLRSVCAVSQQHTADAQQTNQDSIAQCVCRGRARLQLFDGCPADFCRAVAVGNAAQFFVVQCFHGFTLISRMVLRRPSTEVNTLLGQLRAVKGICNSRKPAMRAQMFQSATTLATASPSLMRLTHSTAMLRSAIALLISSASACAASTVAASTTCWRRARHLAWYSAFCISESSVSLLGGASPL
ncbi:MAG: hypothetical protein [Caudoviricetes sp.]|nr:MAG: hypothetical protein [Caudoviricetes sp.]